MIDTIVFLLHGVNEKNVDLSPDSNKGYAYKSDFNRLLYERLLEYEHKYIQRTAKFKSTGEVVNDEDTLFLRKSNPRIFMLNRQGGIFQSIDKTETFFYPVSGKVQTSSSDYHTNFRVNENQDAIEFTLAVPKYFYGHNVAQYVPNVDSKRFKENPFSIRDFYGQINILHSRIVEFIYTFFNDLSELLDMPSLQSFDIRKIELKRIDLCYNQLFPSYAMAQDFLRSQRKFYKSRTRSDSQVVQDRDTSLFYRHSVDGFFFKIYLKGDEFLANDYKRLLKINDVFFTENSKTLLPQMLPVFKKHFPDAYNKYNGGVHDLIFSYYKTYSKSDEFTDYCSEIEHFFPFKLSFLVQESKKILRYEMSFTNTYMSTIYKSKIFRSSDTNWRYLKTRHNLVKRYDLLLSQGSQNAAKFFKLKHSIVAEDRFIYEVIDRSLHKKHFFFLVGTPKMRIHETRFMEFSSISSFRKYKMDEAKEALLSPELLKVMCKKFTDEIDFFQLKEFEDTISVLEQIDKYNEAVSKKVGYFINSNGLEALRKMTHTKKRKLGYSKINKPRLKIVLDRLDNNESIESIIKDLGFSKSSKYQLLDDLKIFDIHKQTVKSKFSHRLITTDFRPYYEKFFLDRQYHRKLFPNPFLVSFDSIRDGFTNSFVSV